jgi:hypothetical protein
MGRACCTHGRRGEMRNAYKILVGKSEVKRPLGRCNRRWGTIIKLVLRKHSVRDEDWIHIS